MVTKSRVLEVIGWFLLCMILENAFAVLMGMTFLKDIRPGLTVVGAFFLALCQIDGLYARPVWFAAIWFINTKPKWVAPAIAPVISLFVTYGLIGAITPKGLALFIAGPGIFQRPIVYKIISSTCVSVLMFLYWKGKGKWRGESG